MELEGCLMYHYYNGFPQYSFYSREAGFTKTRAEQLEEFPYQVEIVVDSLTIPWAIATDIVMAISEDGKILFTERTGNVRVIENGVLNPQPLITFGPPFTSVGEGGLLGIALDPDYLQNRMFYVMHTYREGGQLYNRIVRLMEDDNEATINQVIFDKIPGSQNHNGGRIKIGPDRKLYIATGDAGNPSLAQNLNSTAGKILRLNLDGSIPEDNPFPGSPVFSLGHRNTQGLSFRDDISLYASEHGPTARDEINLILPGANYGWPLVQGDQDTDKIVVQQPVLQSGDVTWAPSGITFVTQGPWQGKLLVATLRGERLLVITLSETGTEVLEVESHLENTYGRLREVVEGRDGSIYLTTSNMDGRGNIRQNDDKIIRLIPK